MTRTTKRTQSQSQNVQGYRQNVLHHFLSFKLSQSNAQYMCSICSRQWTRECLLQRTRNNELTRCFDVLVDCIPCTSSVFLAFSCSHSGHNGEQGQAQYAHIALGITGTSVNRAYCWHNRIKMWCTHVIDNPSCAQSAIILKWIVAALVASLFQYRAICRAC